MNGLPKQAQVVVIGAGIVGNSLAYHLAQLGWRDIVLLDKGPLPNPGGSTGHASNFIFLVDHSKEMTKFTLDSVKQYQALGVFTQSGGIEVARTPERAEELKRRLAAAKAWGIDAELITPAKVKQLVPYINEQIILGGFYTPGVGVVDSLRAGTLMREQAQALGALRIIAKTEITGIDVQNGRVCGVRTTSGDIQAETVVICCGVWSPRLARLAGAGIPLTPAVHQMISVGPVPLFADTVGEIKYPILRDMDTNMYERQHGSDLEVGSYDHRPILLEPEEIPSIEKAALSPTELPFTAEDFDPSLERALELIPAILGDERVGIRHAINGLLSLTPDGFPILGETPEGRITTSGDKVSLAESRLVVGGGRGVGSTEGFQALEALAHLLGGAVGCSRAVTSNGWRPHADQIGQTGTRIAPDLYIACGISGAIQHMVACAGAKHILAINTDPGAPILSKADYAIIGDLHQVIPALMTAIKTLKEE